MICASNCKFLAEKVKTLEENIKILEGALEMERHSEKHTLESAAILHELYNDMGKLGLECQRMLHGTQFDMRPHMESDRWPLIYAVIQQHLQKIYNGKNTALKERHWIPDSDGTYDLERIRLSRPSHISVVNWDAQIGFWNDPKNRARAAQNKQNRAKSKVICRQGSRYIAALQDMHMESSATREYPSLIHTFFLTLTVNGVFLNPEDKALYDEMLRLQGLGSNTETGVPYTEDEIMAIVRGGKQRGHIPGVGRVLPRQGTVIPPPPPCTHSSDVVKLKKREKVLTRQVNMFMKLFRSDDKFSQMLTQLESQPEIGGGSGSGGPGDDEQGHDEDDGEDGEDEDDS
ncbi:RNA-directed DNA polymerase, eukaryota [Tanacetum coccineum]